MEPARCTYCGAPGQVEQCAYCQTRLKPPVPEVKFDYGVEHAILKAIVRESPSRGRISQIALSEQGMVDLIKELGSRVIYEVTPLRNTGISLMGPLGRIICVIDSNIPYPGMVLYYGSEARV